MPVEKEVMTTESETDVSVRPDAHAAEGTAVPVSSPSSADGDSGDFILGIRHRLQQAREATIRATPPFIVNHATNFIGVAQLFAEVMMLKSAGVVFFKNGRDVGKRLNAWQVGSTLTGVAAWTIGALVPDQKEDEEKIDAAVKLYHQSPVKYFINKFEHGFHFFDPNYKREQIGLGVTAAGLLSAFSGFTSINRLANKPYFNGAHSLGGLITATAGAMLWFSPTAEQGWKRFATAIWARFATLPFVVHSKFKNNDLWGYYSTAQATFTGSGMTAYLLGGAEKREDGTIVDHTELRHKASKKYGKHSDFAPVSSVAPATLVSAVSDHQVSVAADKTKDNSAAL